LILFQDENAKREGNQENSSANSTVQPARDDAASLHSRCNPSAAALQPLIFSASPTLFRVILNPFQFFLVFSLKDRLNMENTQMV
jgi:hypothetical protein